MSDKKYIVGESVINDIRYLASISSAVAVGDTEFDEDDFDRVKKLYRDVKNCEVVEDDETTLFNDMIYVIRVLAPLVEKSHFSHHDQNPKGIRDLLGHLANRIANRDEELS